VYGYYTFPGRWRVTEAVLFSLLSVTYRFFRAD
jgi:hypothetical protein